MAKSSGFRFSLGPWCLDTGRDAFGPPVRKELSLSEVLKFCAELGYQGIELHDDDIVPNIDDRSHGQITNQAAEIRKQIDEQGLETVFVAPRLWEDRHTIDGAATSNSVDDRRYALERARKAIDIAQVMGTKRLIYFFGREGTYMREAKDPQLALDRILSFVNELLQYDKSIQILGETKPNEPMDLTYCPTAGHFIALAYKSVDPSRVGVCIESAHCIMCGLDPAEELAHAVWHDKLWCVHLDDQNGPKFNEHRTFGAVNLRQALNQVMVLDRGGYGSKGEFIGFETRSLRTQSTQKMADHLRNCRRIFLRLLDVSRGLDPEVVESLRAKRDYEELEMYVLQSLIGVD